MEQPGYDAMADIYAGTFSGRLALLSNSGLSMCSSICSGTAMIGRWCAISVAEQVISPDIFRSAGSVSSGSTPAPAMLAHARRGYPGLSFVDADAWASEVALEDCSGVIASGFSFIHVEPRGWQILASWFRRLTEGSLVLIACQGSDNPGVHEFDHAVARAWRWHPDTLADALTSADYRVFGRSVVRAGFHRFPEVHIVAKRSVAQGNGDDVRS